MLKRVWTRCKRHMMDSVSQDLLMISKEGSKRKEGSVEMRKASTSDNFSTHRTELCEPSSKGFLEHPAACRCLFQSF